MSVTAQNQNRQPPGTPIGGQWAETRRAEAVGVELIDTPSAESGDVEKTPLSMPGAEVIAALRSGHDVLGLGAGSQTERDGIDVYYAADDSGAIGIDASRDDNVLLYDYDDEDYDFERPHLLNTEQLSASDARERVATLLGVNLETSRLIAFAQQMTGSQKELLAAAHEESTAGARQDSIDEATRAVRDAANDGHVPATTNIAHGQQSTAITSLNDEDHRVRAAVLNAVWALQHRDLLDDPRVSQEGYGGRRRGWTQAAYDQMTGPVREVLGPIYPGDAPVERLRPGFEDDVIAEAYATGSPHLRAQAADVARAVMADRLADMGAVDLTLYVTGGQVRVSSVGFARDPNPDTVWSGYRDSRDIAEEYVNSYVTLDDFKSELIATGRYNAQSAGEDMAAMTYEIDDYAGDSVRAAVELGDVLRDEVTAKAAAAS